MGKVEIKLEYAVDMDNEEMVNHAKECLYEDMMDAVKYNEMFKFIEVTEDNTLSVDDIPDFLMEDEEDYSLQCEKMSAEK